MTIRSIPAAQPPWGGAPVLEGVNQPAEPLFNFVLAVTAISERLEHEFLACGSGWHQTPFIAPLHAKVILRASTSSGSPSARPSRLAAWRTGVVQSDFLAGFFVLFRRSEIGRSRQGKTVFVRQTSLGTMTLRRGLRTPSGTTWVWPPRRTRHRRRSRDPAAWRISLSVPFRGPMFLASRPPFHFGPFDFAGFQLGWASFTVDSPASARTAIGGFSRARRYRPICRAGPLFAEPVHCDHQEFAAAAFWARRCADFLCLPAQASLQRWQSPNGEMVR